LPDPIEKLKTQLKELERRVSALEGPSPAPKEQVRLSIPVPHAGFSVLPIVTLVGRTLVILGGAFFLRYLTETQVLREWTGVGLGLAYASVWLWFANSAARKKGEEVNATFYGISAAVVGYPLIWEATAKFGYLSAPVAAVILAIFSIGTVAVVSHRRMYGVAFVNALPAAISMLSLGFLTRNLTVFLSTLLLFGGIISWRSRKLSWPSLNLTVAAVVDLAFMLAIFTELLRPPGAPSLVSLRMLGAGHLVFLLMYVGLACWNGSLTDQLQGFAALCIGLIGLWFTESFGWAVLLISGGLYFMAYRPRAVAGRIAFLFFSTSSLMSLVTACGILLSRDLFAITASLLALAFTVIGARVSRVSLGVHGGIVMLIAAISSDLWRRVYEIFAGRVLSFEGWVSPQVILAFLAAALACSPLAYSKMKTLQLRYSWTTFPALASTSLCLGAAVICAYVQVTGTEPAILRITVLSTSAVVLAYLSRYEHARLSKWLVIPYLVFGGLKLAIQDLPAGNTSVLFVSLAVYGVALILTPRLVRPSTSRKL
jgi:hypothetical protein